MKRSGFQFHLLDSMVFDHSDYASDVINNLSIPFVGFIPSEQEVDQLIERTFNSICWIPDMTQTQINKKIVYRPFNSICWIHEFGLSKAWVYRIRDVVFQFHLLDSALRKHHSTQPVLLPFNSICWIQTSSTAVCSLLTLWYFQFHLLDSESPLALRSTCRTPCSRLSIPFVGFRFD